MKHGIPVVAYFAPYPGSALGNQLIAEGKSLMSKDNYHRFPGDRKLKGIDYDFYAKLFNGHYHDEIVKGLAGWGREELKATKNLEGAL